MAKIGLVLEGGAMRGLFSAGVCDVMLEQNIRFDGMIGVSAGVTFGCNFKSKQNGRAIRYCKQYAKEPRFCSARSFLKTGDFFGAEFCYHTLPEQLDIFDSRTYAENPMPMFLVATDVFTGKPVYHEVPEINYDAYEWIRASASMPLAARMVTVEGRTMLDGGISDSIPLQWFERAGYERNVVVLTQPAGYVKQPNKLTTLARLYYRKYPALIHAMTVRHEMYNAQTAYVTKTEASGQAFVIRPAEKLPVHHMTDDPRLMQRIYNLGRDAALRVLPELRNFLNQAEHTQPAQ